MFDWLKNLFSGGNNKSSGSNSRLSTTTNRSSSGSSGQRPAADNSAALAKQREEEERKRKAALAAKAAEDASRLKQQQQFDTVLKKPMMATGAATAFDPTTKLQKVKIVGTGDTTPNQKEITRIAAEKLPKVKQELEQQDAAGMKKAGWLDKLIYKVGGKQGLDERANVAARTRASADVQERNGYEPDKDVKAYNDRTATVAAKASTDAAETIKKTKTGIDIARWIPGAGLGELGANAIRGNFSGSKEADDRVLQEQNDLTPAQIESLSPEDRSKYLMIAKGGLAAGVLDVAGLGAGSLIKGGARSGGKQLLKKATTKELIKDIASKEGAKTLAKNAAVGAGTGAGIGYGGTKIMGGSDEEARQNAFTGAVAGTAGGAASSPFDSAVKLVKGSKPGVREVKTLINVAETGAKVDQSKIDLKPKLADDGAKIPGATDSVESSDNKIEVAPGVKTDMATDNTPAYQRRAPLTVGAADAQMKLGVNNVPDDALNADLRAASQSDPMNTDLDVPTFLRKNAGAKLKKATDEMQSFDERIAGIESNSGRSADFADKEAIAAAYKVSPKKGKALEKLIASRGDRVDSEAALKDAIVGRSNAQRDIDEATRAQVANERLNAPQADLNIPDPTSIRTLAKAVETTGDEVPMADFSASIKAGQPLRKAAPTTADSAVETAPTQTELAQAAAAGNPELPTGAVDAQGNPIVRSDKEVVQALADEGVVAPRGASVVATQEDQLAKAADDVVRRETDGTNAPNVRERVTSRITDEDLRDDLMQNAPRKETVNLADAELSAKNYLNELDDEALVSRFSGEVKVSEPTGFYTALNGIRRLERVNTPEADVAIRNALDAMTDYAAESGRGLRTTQILFEDMPATMKVDYLVNKLKKAGAELDDTKRAQLSNLVEISDNSTSNLRGLEDQARKMLDDGSITNGNISPEVTAQVRSLQDDIVLAARQKELTSGDAYRFYQEQLQGSPEGKTPMGKKFGDIGRTLMLSSPSGRVFDILSTTATAADGILSKNLSNLIGKGVNLVKGAGTVTDTIANPRQLMKGLKEGAIRTKEAFQGNDHVEDFLGEAKRATRGDINSGGGIVRQTIRAAVEAPTNLTRGLRNDELYRQGMQEAAKQGLKGDAQTAYAELRSIVPTNQQLDKAVDAQMRANMLHENGASRMLNGLARSLDSNKALGGWLAPVLRNQVAPFTSWLGGSLNRTFTDKNVLYNAGHALVEAKRGNVQGVVDDVSRLAVNSAEAYAAGVLLTQSGLITTTDANGDDYSGLYFHIGDRYIPVAVAGTAAIPLILGNAFEQSSQAAAEDGNGVEAFVKSLVTNTLKNAGVASLFGGENNLQSTVKKITNGEPIDAGAEFIGDFVRQYIPSLTGDVNAFLDQTGLNPTGEAANTKVTETNPATGREVTDVLGTEINKTIGRVPFAAQTLDRNEGTAAKDVFDRMFKGNHETSEGVQKREGEQSLADTKKQLEDEGVPTKAEDIKAFAESGDYDKAIKGTQYRLAEMEGDDKVPESRRKALRDEITKYGLERDGVPTTDDGVKARVESGDFDSAVRGLQYQLSKIENDRNKPASEKQDIRDQIARTEITRDGKFAPTTVALYKDTSESEWRSMGDSESEYYDPETYDLLSRYDDALTGAGVSLSAKGGDKKKLRPKTSGSGGGRGGLGGFNVSAAVNDISFSPDSLKIRKAEFAPPQSAIPVIQKVQNYDQSKLKKIKITKGVVR